MNISNRASRSLASVIAASLAVSPLVVSPASAKATDSMQDLVGARAGQAEATLTQRGWAYAADGVKSGTESSVFWWNAGQKACMKVVTRDGRYAAMDEAKASDCGQKSSGNGTAIAVAAVGAAALAAVLLTRKSKDRNNNGGYQPEWQQVEVHNLSSGTMRIFSQPSTSARVVRGVDAGTILRNFGCEDTNGESWCEVATMDGRTNGWARDRYLRVSNSVGPYPPGGGNWGGGWGNGNGNGWGNGNGNGWGSGYNGIVEVYGLSSGSLKIMANPSKDGRVVNTVSAGTRLRSQGCQSNGGENWCQVSTMNGRTQGWARERYLRQR